jgi:nucleoid DNA-binding protein
MWRKRVRKSEIVNRLAEEYNIPVKEAKRIVEEMFFWIAQKTAQEGSVQIRGFCVFRLRRRGGRFIKNPKTGIETYIEERYLIGFKPSKKLLIRLNEKV